MRNTLIDRMVQSFAKYCVSNGAECTADELVADWDVTTSADAATAPTGGYPDYRVVVLILIGKSDGWGDTVILTGYAAMPEFDVLDRMTAIIDTDITIIPQEFYNA